MAKLKCDNCGHYFFRRTSDLIMFFGGGFSLFGLLIGLLWASAFSMLVIGLGALVIGLIYRSPKKDQYQCLNCKKTFSISEAKKLQSP